MVHPAQRYKNVTICARVQTSSGAKRPAPTPMVTPFPAAHATAGAYHAAGSTSAKPASVRWFYRLASYAIAPLSVLIFNNASTVPVYHDTRLITTFRRSIELLQEGRNMIIFPEKNKRYNNILYDFQDKFVDLARFYYRKTKQALLFVPVYNAPKLHKTVIGKPVRFDPGAPIEQERERICKAMKDAITAMAAALPEHTVIPYRNIPKRLYPKNIPIEVYTDEEAGS